MGTAVRTTLRRPKRLMSCASDVRAVRSPAPPPGLMTRRAVTAAPPGTHSGAVSATKATPSASRSGRMGMRAVSPRFRPRATVRAADAGIVLATPPGMYDATIIGGGPAGLSAALVLARCRRRVLLCDSGEYRNAASHGVHAFLTRDGILPADLRRLGRQEIARYGVEARESKVDDVRRADGHFTVTVDGDRLETRTLLIATGVVDRVPRIAGIDGLYGRSVFHCPY